ncbi:hypothetical protein [Pedobacter insulae]|uniref:YhhN-like protein n=1 Tax=Pedobacter insulae TaxID=414048 RepID=A0A1I2ZJV5_9SPHI|nr:hypothetical protein [Pedobacter insulae]SFH37769.1 hypothetical protein SAMN04489864_11063 [Pedobacter insulae]
MYLNFIFYGIYLFCLIFCLIAGGMNWHVMQPSLKIFYVFVLLVFIGEVGALIMEYHTGNNTQLYNFADIVQAVIVFIYFGHSLKKPVTGIVLALISLIFGIYNYYWLQESDLINSNFLLWSGLVVISLALYSLIFLYKKDGVTKLSRFALFWISSALLLYWMFNLLSLQVFNTFVQSNLNYALILNAGHIASNVVCYSIIALVFHFTPRLNQ